MAKQKPKNKGIVRLIRWIVIVAILVTAGLIGVNYFLPMLTSDSITTYNSYTVTTGDIETWMSFSATLEVKKSESFTPGEMTKVKEVYVASGDEVSEGDPLMLLTNGELFTAGFDGVVNEIRVGVGDWVREYFSIAQVSDLENLDVTLSVDEYDIRSLSVGDPCTIKVISLDKDFDATIAHINRVSSSAGTLAYYTVSCELAVPPEVLPGMRAAVMIPDEAVMGVTILPLDALAFDTDDHAYVLRKLADGSYEKQFIETGLSDGMRVEISSGLQTGDVVYAVAGTQNITPAFSLEDLYIAVFGKKVVINETRGQIPGRTGSMPDWIDDGTEDMDENIIDGTAFTPPDTEIQRDTNRITESQSVSTGETVQDTHPADTEPQPE